MTKVETQKVRKFIKMNAKFMTKSEISYSLQILRNLNYERRMTDTLKHFNYLRNKKLQHHKKVADFAIKIFEACDVKYRKFQQKKYKS